MAALAAGLTVAGRWLINLVLALVVAGLALLVRSELAREARTSRLTALTPETIERVEIRRPGLPAIVLVRRAGSWELLAPLTAPADGAAVARLLPIAMARSQRVLPAALLDLQALGLAVPSAQLLLNGLELRFGTHDPIQWARYVQVGDLVHLIDDRSTPLLQAPAVAWVSRKLLPPGFSPGLGSLDGRPLGASTLALLVDARADRVEDFDGELTGALLRVESADGAAALRFLVADGGRRWTRLDWRLSWWFAEPPLPPTLFGAADSR